jgi:hypothetical protein
LKVSRSGPLVASGTPIAADVRLPPGAAKQLVQRGDNLLPLIAERSTSRSELIDKDGNNFKWMRNYCFHTAGATGSIPVPPTIYNQ